MSVSIERYRELLNDYVSTDEQIAKRIKYIEALCRNVIREELDKFQYNRSGKTTL